MQSAARPVCRSVSEQLSARQQGPASCLTGAHDTTPAPRSCLSGHLLQALRQALHPSKAKCTGSTELRERMQTSRKSSGSLCTGLGSGAERNCRIIKSICGQLAVHAPWQSNQNMSATLALTEQLEPSLRHWCHCGLMHAQQDAALGSSTCGRCSFQPPLEIVVHGGRCCGGAGVPTPKPTPKPTSAPFPTPAPTPVCSGAGVAVEGHGYITYKGDNDHFSFDVALQDGAYQRPLPSVILFNVILDPFLA